MRIVWRWSAQAFQQPALAQGGIEQVGATQYMGNTIICVIQGAGQLIAEQAVTTADDKSATVLVQIVADAALNGIQIAKLPVRNLQTDGGVGGGGHRSADTGMVVIQVCQLFAGQAAVKGMAAVEQGIHGFLIGEVALVSS